MTQARNLIAVDIGNSRLKAGRFVPQAEWQSSLPEPVDTLSLPIVNKAGEFDVDQFCAWCDQHAADGERILLASVHRGAAARLTDAVAHWIERSQRDIAMNQLSHRNLPLSIRVEAPARVGIDRLLAALAASRLRRPHQPAIVVSMGTAITVDLLEADGAFAGGAILPGIAMSARALAADTDALPHVDPEQFQKPPAALGKSTTSAIESGLYWGTIGAIGELTSRLSSTQPTSPELFLTGGASWQVADQLALSVDRTVRHVPHLVLAAMALVDAETSGAGRD